MKKYFMVAWLLMLTLLITACGASPKRPHNAKPAPAPTYYPREVTFPKMGCPLKSGQKTHAMGDCLPAPPTSNSLGLTPTQSKRCIDLSNNNPIESKAAWEKIAKVVSCAAFKVNELGYVDPTARPMALLARSVGLIVTGYDFQHVCDGSAAADANEFARLMVADDLTGNGTLPGDADVEDGNRSCNARAWESAWHATATKDLHRTTDTYTGAWFWNPEFGCGYWPGGASWISGYGVSYPYMPCGHSELDLFQNQDNGFNGYNYSDMSYWISSGTYISLIQKKPVPAKLICFGSHASNSATCKKAQANVVSWTKAIKSSQYAYDVRACPAIKKHIIYFTAKIKAQPKSRRLSYRKGALKSSNRVYKKNCAVFAGRIGYYTALVSKTEKEY